MCMGGGGSPKVETPKPPPLPPPLPPPPPPAPVAAEPKKLQASDAKPDIKIGTSKTSSSSRSTRTTSRDSRGSSSLTIGDNQGMTL